MKSKQASDCVSCLHDGLRNGGRTLCLHEQSVFKAFWSNKAPCFGYQKVIYLKEEKK